MKNLTTSAASSVVRALPVCAREGGPDFYLPKEAKARINRFAHHAAGHHGQLVRNRILTSLGALADQGKPLPDLLAELATMISDPADRLAGTKNELRNA